MFLVNTSDSISKHAGSAFRSSVGSLSMKT